MTNYSDDEGVMGAEVDNGWRDGTARPRMRRSLPRPQPFIYHRGMDADSSPAVARVVARVREDRDVLAAMLFGSRARGDAHAHSDTDVCLVLDSPAESREVAARKRLDYLSTTDLDVSVFQLLPLHIRSSVLKEGRVLFVRDEDALYALAVRTARAFEHFRHVQRRYLDEIARG